MNSKLCILIASALIGSSALAYTPNGELVSVRHLIGWPDGGSGHVIAVVRVEAGPNASTHYECYFDSASPEGRTALSVLTVAQVTGKFVELWCHDTPNTIGGMHTNARLLHKYILH